MVGGKAMVFDQGVVEGEVLTNFRFLGCTLTVVKHILTNLISHTTYTTLSLAFGLEFFLAIPSPARKL
jgi:hypothetical protein